MFFLYITNPISVLLTLYMDMSLLYITKPHHSLVDPLHRHDLVVHHQPHHSQDSPLHYQLLAETSPSLSPSLLDITKQTLCTTMFLLDIIIPTPSKAKLQQNTISIA